MTKVHKTKHTTAAQLIAHLQQVPPDTPIGQIYVDQFGQHVWSNDGFLRLQQITFNIDGYKRKGGQGQVRPVVVLWGLDTRAYPTIPVYEDGE